MTPEVEQIKAALRAARSSAELEAIRARYRRRVQELMESPTLHVMAIQITNLANLRRKQLREEENG
ncbi:MAG: hypothetical protein GY772_25440 [bacterium]|nr:hypothetical protein [bacterium]